MLEEFVPAPAGPAGWDRALLAPVTEINERLLDRLRRLAVCVPSPVLADPPAQAMTAAAECVALRRCPALLSQLTEEWRSLDAVMQRRLAGCPYVLLDAGFSQPQRWEQRLTAAVSEASARVAYFSDAEGIALVRRTLLFAWHLTRADRLSARVLLGIGPRIAERIGSCRLHELDALAERAPDWVVPRWEQQPLIWRQLLSLARGGNGAALRQAQLRGLQLLAGASY